MEYEKTHTHRYQYRRMGLVPYKDTPTDKPMTLKQNIVAYLVITAFILMATLAG